MGIETPSQLEPLKRSGGLIPLDAERPSAGLGTPQTLRVPASSSMSRRIVFESSAFADFNENDGPMEHFPLGGMLY